MQFWDECGLIPAALLTQRTHLPLPSTTQIGSLVLHETAPIGASLSSDLSSCEREGGAGGGPCSFYLHAQNSPFGAVVLCCPVLSAVLSVLSVRSLGPLPSQQHQTKRGLVAVKSSIEFKINQFFVSYFPKTFAFVSYKTPGFARARFGS